MSQKGHGKNKAKRSTDCKRAGEKNRWKGSQFQIWEYMALKKELFELFNLIRLKGSLTCVPQVNGQRFSRETGKRIFKQFGSTFLNYLSYNYIFTSCPFLPLFLFTHT